MAEFWVPPVGRKDMYYHCTDFWEAASAAHIYGKKIAAAESFTTDVSRSGLGLALLHEADR